METSIANRWSKKPMDSIDLDNLTSRQKVAYCMRECFKDIKQTFSQFIRELKNPSKDDCASETSCKYEKPLDAHKAIISILENTLEKVQESIEKANKELQSS
ncbi:hypothetical protein COEREDRAFT_88352 [Coemansia reversa NRRL 1564]|uniref:Uncharacterized protein n=1 Tax=Coemansia reversa (strain ATCC 12441 / NRRL 1564) TaxID=763665 RepID=A0A2G5B738_COERN|nr:hypothetical protein COEREDRAFT_88352 [Coemansia reversa NRRL 1564]|eukprot:PIA14825.1 hypothetical protein COEREDRAFT_88352 [Coemansia reversa NRRL 1564]